MLARPTGHRRGPKGVAEMKKLVLVLALMAPLAAHAQKTEKATFAAGCFWCTEEAFETVPDVPAAVSGYMGGKVKHPTYEQVSRGITAQTEVMKVNLNPAKVSDEKLPGVFWVN